MKIINDTINVSKISSIYISISNLYRTKETGGEIHLNHLMIKYDLKIFKQRKNTKPKYFTWQDVL